MLKCCISAKPLTQTLPVKTVFFFFSFLLNHSFCRLWETIDDQNYVCIIYNHTHSYAAQALTNFIGEKKKKKNVEWLWALNYSDIE